MTEVLQNLRYNNMKVFMPGTVFYGNILTYNTNESFEPVPPPEHDYSLDYFTVTSWEDNNTIYFKRGYRATNQGVDMWISYDNATWTNFTSSMTATGIYTLTLNRGEKAYFKGNNDSLCFSTSSNPSFPANESNFHASKYFEVSGNIMSLLWGDDFIGKTTLPNSSVARTFQNLFETVFYQSYNYILSTRNLVIPLKQLTTSCLESMFYDCSKLIYAPKEIQNMAILSSGSTDGNIAMFNHGCTKLQETPIFRQTTSGSNNIYNNICAGMSNIKRAIFLCDSGYPTTANSAPIKYKLSTNTSVSGSAYRDFDTLQANNSFISIWAEAETPYDGYIEGCSDYFIAGDTVTLIATNLNGTGFQGWYEDGQLVSSSSTYTFTASTSRNLTVRFRDVVPQYTPVTEVKMTNPQPSQWNTPYRNVWIDTGVVFPNTQDIWIEAEMTKYTNYDDTIIGLCYDVQVAMGYVPGTNGRYAFRFFSPDSKAWMDATYGDGSSGNRTNNVNLSSNTTFKIEIGKQQNGKMRYIVNGSSYSNEISVSTYDYASLSASNHIFCCITGFGLRRVKIWSDYTKTTLLFDGIAVIDGNETPCVYDAVSNSLKYFEYKNGYSGAGTVTYIQ